MIDSHASELASSAEIALPSRWFSERAGTFTNHQGRVQRFQAVLEPPFEAWAEGEVLRQIGRAAGLPGYDAPFEPVGVSKRLAESVPAFADADFESVGEQGRELG